MIEAFKLIGSISLKGGEKVKGVLKNINSAVEESGMNFHSLGTGLKMAGGALIGVGASMGVLGGAVAKLGISYNAMQEQSEVAWTTLLGSSEKAQEQMKGIAEFAKATPFETEHVDAMAKYMHNAGLEGKAMFDELMKVSDVSSAFAIPAHEAKEMARQMSQVRNAGVAYTEDLNILEDKGVPIMKTIASNLGITTAEAKKMASEGKITSEIYLQAFDKIAGGVKGASEAQSKTFNGMISSLSDGAKMLAGILTEQLFEKAKGFLERINTVVGDMVTVFQEGGSLKEALATFLPDATAQTVVNVLNGITNAFKWIFNNWQTIVTALAGITSAFVAFHVITNIVKAFQLFNALMIAYRAGTVGATLAQWGFNTALLANPITWIALLIGALVVAIILLWKNWDKVSAFLTKSWKAIKSVGSSVWKGITTTVTGAGRAIGDSWNKTTTKLTGFFTKMYSNAKEKFNGIKSSASTAFNNAKTAMLNPIETAYNKIKSWIEKIKGFFSGLKLKIPKPSLPKMPKISLTTASKTIMGKTFTYPTGFKFHAKGALLNGATMLGMAGGNMHFAGEAGREAIMPLEGRHMFPLAQAIAKFLGNDGLNSSETRLEIPLYLDGREIARAIAPKVDQALGKINRRTSRARGVNPI
jgi:tape measure domain-containing protein